MENLFKFVSLSITAILVSLVISLIITELHNNRGIANSSISISTSKITAVNRVNVDQFENRVVTDFEIQSLVKEAAEDKQVPIIIRTSRDNYYVISANEDLEDYVNYAGSMESHSWIPATGVERDGEFYITSRIYKLESGSSYSFSLSAGREYKGKVDRNSKGTAIALMFTAI
jgi:hypothetical protein